MGARAWLESCRQSKECYPIQDAVFAGSADAIRLLISAGFDVQGIDRAGNTAALHPHFGVVAEHG